VLGGIAVSAGALKASSVRRPPRQREHAPIGRHSLVGSPYTTSLLVEQAAATRACSAWGGPRDDGRWVDWLEYAAVGQRQVRGTSQGSRADLEYWATGLEVAYLQGAFARTR
jgi:hypothetical protein